MFSQSAEEQVILKYFGDHVGTFVDLGSNDGITFSNTRSLALKGWKGVLLEPDPEAFARLQQLYKGTKGIYTYNYGISNCNCKKHLYKSGSILGQGDTGLVSTFKPEETKRFDKITKYEGIEVQVYKWKTAINRWAIRSFDFVSIDIEGEEMNVLPDMDLTNTKLIVIEFNGNNDLKAAYEKYMEGFKLIYTSPENLIYGR